jgi:hypothetical protein
MFPPEFFRPKIDRHCGYFLQRVRAVKEAARASRKKGARIYPGA